MGLADSLKATAAGSFVRRVVGEVRGSLVELSLGVEDLKLLAAEPSLARIRALSSLQSLRDAELRVYSQFGDDGIIHYLTQRLALVNDTFVEFGVGNYRESNTRLLLVRDNWRGLVMDSSEQDIAAIRRDRISWRHHLESRCAFIDRDNINALISGAGVTGPIGLLHVDIDGNDYWVWERLDVVDPDIVIAEYNAVLGFERPVSIPYDPGFRRDRAHPSWLYWGASLPALAHLASRKGYVFVGTNLAGNNAYFVRERLALDLPRPHVAHGRDSRYRESRGADGALTFLSGAARARAIEDQLVVDVVTGETLPLRDALTAGKRASR